MRKRYSNSPDGTKPVLLHIPIGLLNKIDEISHRRNESRTYVILNCLEGNLDKNVVEAEFVDVEDVQE